MSSENGWEPAKATPEQCEWITVPGTNVRLQVLKGQPLAIMRAYAADYNAYVEPLRDPDSGSWTPTNSVATSNHLNGTAMDLNWDSHPFRVADAGYSPQMIVTMREILNFYEDTMFWSNDWDDPKDAMHHQMGYNTYGSENVARVQDFINRKIRPDGFSTFRRGTTPAPPPVLSRADRYALLIIAEGQRRGITPRGIKIALATGLVESNLTVYANAKVPASMSIPHDAVGSDGYSVGIFQQQVRDTGNGWWWGDAATCMDPTSSAGLFYDRLARLDYNGANSPGSYAQKVQQSAFPDRYDQRFSEAEQLYNRLVGQPPPAPLPGEDDLSAEAERMIAEIHRELTQRYPSRSPFRALGEGPVDTMAGMLLNTDGSEHVEVVTMLAEKGHRPSLARLWDIANADPVKYPDRQQDRAMAQTVLDKVTKAANAVTQAAPVAPVFTPPAAPVVYETPPPATNGSKSTGDTIGNLYTALEEMHLADALPIEARAPLAALISVLQTKNGSAL